MQFKSVVLALAAASAVSAANSTNGTHANGTHANGSNHTSSTAAGGASQLVGAGVFGVAAAAGVAMLL